MLRLTTAHTTPTADSASSAMGSGNNAGRNTATSHTSKLRTDAITATIAIRMSRCALCSISFPPPLGASGGRCPCADDGNGSPHRSQNRASGRLRRPHFGQTRESDVDIVDLLPALLHTFDLPITASWHTTWRPVAGSSASQTRAKAHSLISTKMWYLSLCHCPGHVYALIMLSWICRRVCSSILAWGVITGRILCKGNQLRC